MDSGAIVAVIGTLAGVALAYLLQQRVAERSRRWTLEDERRKLKRDLLAKRLEPIEEAVKLMGSAIYTAGAKEFGLPIPIAAETASRQGIQRVHEMRSDAWSAVVITGSIELMRDWITLSSVYDDWVETNGVGRDGQERADKAQIAIMKLLDDMRLG